MSRNHRSMSQILQRHQAADHPPARTSYLENEQRWQSNELRPPAQSKLSFGEARTAGKAAPSPQPARRNKSLSCSKLRLFEKARQVGREETFQKPLASTAATPFCLSASTSQFSQYRHARREGKLHEIVEKKLIIDRVVRSLQDEAAAKLSIRAELEQHRQARLPLATQENFTRSKMPSELVYSKDFELENESKVEGCQRCGEGPLLGESRGEDSLRNYSKELAAGISESIKKELAGQYQEKERELEQRYVEKERQYLEKFRDLETVMEDKLEKQRALLLQNIHAELEKQFEKAREVREVEQGEVKAGEVKAGDKNQIKQEISLKGNRIENEAKVVELIKPEAMGASSRKGSRSYVEEPIAEARAVEKQASPPAEPPRQLKKEQKRAKGSEKEKSVYRQVDSSLIEDIEEVTLEGNPQKNRANPREEESQRINKSFNIENKLDNSFSSERPVLKKEKPKEQKKETGKEREREKEQEAMLYPPKKPQPSEQQLRRAEQEQRKGAIREKLKEYSQYDPIMVLVGEVAGFCSKFCKKSAVDWRMPSLLLYRYCLDLFRSYKLTFEQAERLRLVRREQLEDYRSYESVMEANIDKMLKSFQKKLPIPEAYRQIIDSPAIELERLRPHAVREAKRYVEELRRSAESSMAGGSLDVVQCGLRIINSVLAIRRISGEPAEMIPGVIGELGREESFALFEEWSRKLLEE